MNVISFQTVEGKRGVAPIEAVSAMLDAPQGAVFVLAGGTCVRTTTPWSTCIDMASTWWPDDVVVAVVVANGPVPIRGAVRLSRVAAVVAAQDPSLPAAGTVDVALTNGGTIPIVGTVEGFVAEATRPRLRLVRPR